MPFSFADSARRRVLKSSASQDGQASQLQWPECVDRIGNLRGRLVAQQRMQTRAGKCHAGWLNCGPPPALPYFYCYARAGETEPALREWPSCLDLGSDSDAESERPCADVPHVRPT